ncbi:hypothetical protein [Arthrobacter psychrolactophilus]
MESVQSRGKWVLSTAMVLLGASLTGCGQHPGYQESLVSAADKAQGTFALPRGGGVGAPIPQWDTVLIVCPYSDMSRMPEPFAKDAGTLDTGSTDAAQWLLFAEANNVTRLSIERSAVDFCHGDSQTGAYDSNQVWRAEQHDGAWLITPEEN